MLYPLSYKGVSRQPLPPEPSLALNGAGRLPGVPAAATGVRRRTGMVVDDHHPCRTCPRKACRRAWPEPVKNRSGAST